MRASEIESPIAYLGPEGSFAHHVAIQRFGNAGLRPFRTIPEVFSFLAGEGRGRGVVPIENSSGGTIMPTVDGLIDNALFVQEELSLDVKLALVGREGTPVKVIYSHFAPLQHCERWLNAHYPGARHVATPSTSGAAQLAAREDGAAAIGPVENADAHGLDVLYYPIESHIPNVTQFFVIGHAGVVSETSVKTSLVVALADRPGSLCLFLEPFKNHGVSLKRIQSRPIVGQPNTYKFFVEIEGKEQDEQVKEALKGALAVADSIKSLGSYPVRGRYQC